MPERPLVIMPRFDSGTCVMLKSTLYERFAGLLGTAEHGRWLLASDPDPERTLRVGQTAAIRFIDKSGISILLRRRGGKALLI